jgi:hypothetical protein
LDDVSDQERVVFVDDINVLAKGRLPDEACIFENDVIDVLFLVDKKHWFVLAALICPLFDLYFPLMDSLDYINSHVSEPTNIYKNIADNADSVLDSFIDLQLGIALLLNVLHVCQIFVVVIMDVLFFKHSQNSLSLSQFAPYLLNTLLPRLHGPADDMVEAFFMGQEVKFLFESFLNVFDRSSWDKMSDTFVNSQDAAIVK